MPETDPNLKEYIERGGAQDIKDIQGIVYKENKNLGGITFKRCSFIGDLSLELRTSETQFIDCNFENVDNFMVDGQGEGGIHFEDCRFNKLRVHQFEYLYSFNTTVKELIEVNGVGAVEFDNSPSQVNPINIVRILNRDTPKAPEFRGIRLSHLHVDKLYLVQNRAKKTRIYGGTYGLVWFNAIITDCKIEAGVQTPMQIGKIHYKYQNPDMRLGLDNVNIGELDMRGTDEGTYLLLRNSIVSKVLKAEHSNLKDVSLVNNNLEKAKIYLSWSIIYDDTFTNCVWPTNNILSPNFAENKEHLDFTAEEEIEVSTSELKIQQDLYRRLKQISLTKKDTINALLFYRNEMRVYSRYIDLAKPGKFWDDRVLVYTAKYLTEFGQSWTRPLGFLFGFHFFLYSWLWIRHMEHLDVIGDFFRTLNPVHKFMECYTGLDYLIDLAMRISFTFFAYFIVKATRKYGKL